MKRFLKLFIVLLVGVSASFSANAQTPEEKTEFWGTAEWETALHAEGFSLEVVSETEDKLVVNLYDTSDEKKIDLIAIVTMMLNGSVSGVSWGIEMLNGHTFTDSQGKMDFIELTRDDRFVRVVSSAHVSGRSGYEGAPTGHSAIRMKATMSSVLMYDSVRQIPFAFSTPSWVPKV